LHVDSCGFSACALFAHPIPQAPRVAAYTKEVDAPTLVSNSTVGGRSPDARPVVELARGTTVGRYVILDVLGRGAMGVVHAAYDPELDRKIALKLVRARPPERDGAEDQRSHTLREAQAMARLRHPNTVVVYDVGTHGDHVFLAMELVSGGTLRQWLASRTRPWREVVDAFVLAGRGLAAAHRAGIVHRDFKLDNVLVADDKPARALRVLVTDFGLARGTAPSEDGVPARLESSGSDLRLSRTGRIAGTPAYMAPEVVSGRGADERSDQFSFCVALFEALHGVRPFEGETLAALALSLTEGRIREPPSNVRLPTFVRRVVLRGLSVDPEDRFADMDALLRALTDDPLRRWRRALGGAGIVILVGSAAVLGYTQADRRGACDDAEARLRGVWDDERRTAVERAMLATEVVYAQDTAQRVLAGLDRYADAWTRTAAEACRASERQTTEDTAHPGLCLARRRAELSALVDVFAHADAAVVERATQAVGKLGSLDVCLDRDAPERFAVPHDPALAAEVEALRERLDRVRARSATTDRPKIVAALAAEVVEDARALDYAPVIAEALTASGHAVIGADPGTAKEHLREAYWIAIAHGDDALAGVAASHLVRTHVELGDYRDAHEWAAHCDAFLRRTGADPLRNLDLDILVTRLLALEARHDEAMARLARWQATLSELPPHRSIVVLAQLADLSTQKGQYDEASAIYEDALVRARETLGPRHPSVLALVNNLAIVRYEQGDFEAASEELARALALAEPLWGVQHLGVAALRNNLGSALERQDRLAEALAEHERALAIRLALLDPDSLDVAESYNNRAAVFNDLGELEAAVRDHARALEIRERILGAEHPLVAATLSNLGLVMTELGDHEGARGHFERALAIQETALGSEHPDLPRTHAGLARVAAELGDWATARDAAERAMAFPTTNLSGASQAQVRFVLARALHARSEAPDRALALAQEARALLPDQGSALGAEIEAFIARHPAETGSTPRIDR
jgi:eukaryotic-like serine/threonine-protein kinase